MKVSELSFAYDSKKILDQISFQIPEGRITAILGSNGSGKSTLFRLMTKNLKPDQGTIYLDEKDISKMKLREFSREVAIVHQQNRAADDMTVEKLVSYGRLPFARKFCGKSQEDQETIKWALGITNLRKHCSTQLGKLSGGQRQRAFIAMALAQNTKVLFLDEPTTFLDIRYQIEILELIRMLNRDYGITIIMVLHDINQAVSYSDEMIGLKDGKIEVQGETKRVITEDVINRLYGVRLKIKEVDGKKFVWNVRHKSM